MQKNHLKLIQKTGKELREMLAYSSLVLAGTGTVAVLYIYAQIAREVATHPMIINLIDEWLSITGRALNEYGLIDDPVSEAELHRWISRQLKMNHIGHL